MTARATPPARAPVTLTGPGKPYRMETPLARLLAKKGMRKVELTVMTGIPERTISRWLSGEGAPSVQHQLTLCRVLKVTPTEMGW